MPKNIKLTNKYPNLIVVIIFTLIIFLSIYYILQYIYELLICNCNNHKRTFVQEGFATSDFQNSKAYFASLASRCNKVQTNIDALNPKIDNLSSGFSGLSSNICYVTSQIDESLAGNYTSNVGPDEQAYPLDVQQQRIAQRKINSAKYVTNLKNIFVQNHDNIPLIECFDDGTTAMTDDESAQLATIRDDLNQQITDTESNLVQLNASLKSVQDEFSSDKLKTYYTTLQYNDKYLKQLASAIVSEGFTSGPESDNDSNAIFTFKPVAQTSSSLNNPSNDPGIRISNLESNYQTILGLFNNLNAKLTKFVNTTANQKNITVTAKSITTDTNAQNALIKKNMESVSKDS